jgi:hypothetical protein
MDLLKNFGPVIGAVAPTIATALGGPLAGMAVRALSGALFGGDESKGVEDISQLLGGVTPDHLAQMKQIDDDFKAKMASLNVDLAKIAEDNTDSARQMQISTKDWIPRVLAVFVSVGFFGILLVMLLVPMPKSDAFTILLGALAAGWGGVMNFYFGSSAGSKAKTDILGQAVNGA